MASPSHRFLFLSFLCRAVTSSAAPSASLPVVVAVDTSSLAYQLPPTYVGATLDWWPPQQEGFGTSTVNLIDLEHPRLIGVARALGPMTLRVGGSLDATTKKMHLPLSNSKPRVRECC